ncbi:MAG: accessory factor UbiK family protein, partial [Rhodocyclaceae bacterium]|nr:accessory factor UbiK family protein [Rhodocyclaceae bacterium]
MLDPKFLENISAQISAALAATPAADIEKNLRAMLTSSFARLDLVTREDFEVQKE